jgi:anti-sigma factor RsiW
MKESKFIELLNLYVDHEISATDAALLEGEVQRNPVRRRIYREYCQMQKACNALADTFMVTAPEKTARTVVARGSRSTWRSFGYFAGSLAAAACLAIVFVNRRPAVHEMASTTPAIAVAATNSAAPRVALQPAFAGLVRSSATANPVAVADRNSLDWMNRVQLQQIPVEQLRFENHQSIQPGDFMLRTVSQAPQQAEMTAFRFQR